MIKLNSSQYHRMTKIGPGNVHLNLIHGWLSSSRRSTTLATLATTNGTTCSAPWHTSQHSMQRSSVQWTKLLRGRCNPYISGDLALDNSLFRCLPSVVKVVSVEKVTLTCLIVSSPCSFIEEFRLTFWTSSLRSC